MNSRRLVKAVIPRGLFGKIEPWGHLGEAVLFNILSGFPARRLKVIGVTGTNGKTSTCFMVHKMLQEAGLNAGLMTTVAYGAGDEIHSQIHHMTNVATPELMKRLKWMRSKKIEWLVLETTSHALAQNRVWGIPISVAVMTNVTHEHLDYHRNMENYLSAKRRLFKMANRNKKGLRVGIINADDPSAGLFESDISKFITYGVNAGQLRARQVVSTASGSDYVAEIGGNKLKIHCNLPGSFNVYNSLAAVAVGRAIDLSQEQIERGIASLKEVEGRMTRLDEGQDFNVIVDYAHTPDSFEKLFKDLKPVSRGRLIVMFGSAGRRDKAKRVVQGELAGQYCDEVIITEEDDRDEKGQEIMEQIATGAASAGKIREKDLFLITDRTEAIKFTLDRALQDDTVLLLGKGHEKTIERADGEHPWDEVATTRQLLQQKTA